MILTGISSHSAKIIIPMQKYIYVNAIVCEWIIMPWLVLSLSAQSWSLPCHSVFAHHNVLLLTRVLCDTHPPFFTIANKFVTQTQGVIVYKESADSICCCEYRCDIPKPTGPSLFGVQPLQMHSDITLPTIRTLCYAFGTWDRDLKQETENTEPICMQFCAFNRLSHISAENIFKSQSLNL